MGCLWDMDGYPINIYYWIFLMMFAFKLGAILQSPPSPAAIYQEGAPFPFWSKPTMSNKYPSNHWVSAVSPCRMGSMIMGIVSEFTSNGISLQFGFPRMMYHMAMGHRGQR